MPKTEQSKLICLLLGLVTIVLFWPATGFDFVNFDDQDYIINNTAIHDGVTWPALVWAFKERIRQQLASRDLGVAHGGLRIVWTRGLGGIT